MNDLEIGVKVNDSDAMSSLKAIDKQIDNISTSAKGAASSTKGMSDVLGGLNSKLDRTKVGSFVKELKGIGSVGTAAVLTIGTLAISIGALAVATAKFGAKTTAAASDMYRMSQATDISTKSISRLTTMVVKGGGALGDASDMVKDFADKLGDAKTGGADLAEKFKMLGVNLNQTNDGALKDTITALSKMEDKSKAMNIGMTIFGDNYSKVAGQIASGNNLMSQNPIFSDKYIKTSKDMTREFNTLMTTIIPLITDAIEPLVSSLSLLFEVMGNFTKSEIFKSIVTNVSSFITGVSSAVDSFLLTIGRAKKESQKLLESANLDDQYKGWQVKYASLSQQILQAEKKMLDEGTLETPTYRGGVPYIGDSPEVQKLKAEQEALKSNISTTRLLIETRDKMKKEDLDTSPTDKITSSINIRTEAIDKQAEAYKVLAERMKAITSEDVKGTSLGMDALFAKSTGDEQLQKITEIRQEFHGLRQEASEISKEAYKAVDDIIASMSKGPEDEKRLRAYFESLISLGNVTSVSSTGTVSLVIGQEDSPDAYLKGYKPISDDFGASISQIDDQAAKINYSDMINDESIKTEAERIANVFIVSLADKAKTMFSGILQGGSNASPQSTSLIGRIFGTTEENMADAEMTLDLATNVGQMSLDLFSTFSDLRMQKAQEEADHYKSLEYEKLDGLVLTSRGREREMKRIDAESEKRRKEGLKGMKAAQIAQVQMSTATSLGSMWASIFSTPAPLPIQLGLGAALSGLLLANDAVQTATIAQQNFTDGGVVDGPTTTGDTIQAGLNADEMVLNRRHIKNLFNAIDSGNIGGGPSVYIENFSGSDDDMRKFEDMYNALVSNGRI